MGRKKKNFNEIKEPEVIEPQVETQIESQPEQQEIQPEQQEIQPEQQEIQPENNIFNLIKKERKKKKDKENESTKELLESLFLSLNIFLPERVKINEVEKELLKNIWSPVISRYIESIENENIQLYLAIGITLSIVGKKFYIYKKEVKNENKNDWW